MYVYQVSSNVSDQVKVIIGNTVNDICGDIISYNNDECDKTNDNEYTVTFFNFKGEEVLTIPEDALKYAILGADSDDVSDNIKEYSQKYWEMNHSTIEIIGFTNPCHFGEVVWDAEYTTDNELDYNLSDDEYEELDNNIISYG